MKSSERIATWLELAVAPEWRRSACRIRVHPVGGREHRCFAISMNDRWLCSSSGDLTVFCGLHTAEHFLKLLRIDDFEQGDAPGVEVSCSDSRYCLCSDRNTGLTRCAANRTTARYYS